MKSNKTTDPVGQRLRSITADLKRYAEKRIELVMLGLGESFSNWIAISVQRTAGAVLMLVGVCFLFVALAIYLDDLLNTPGLGFAIVSVPLFILGTLFVYLKPDRLFEGLQELFENEVIEAIEQNGKDQPAQIEAPETEQSLNKDA
ncbi:Putative Holin-X, holin superfamily III [Fodinibius roseus]|uniref:Putative Holin-X, holin superfamily III n=1 Tax=Fodinibius roseus TaxID=1194090 RepID=A0A1M5C3E9_9BACT|nr:phage holin family protein [Fodinibius roseus]SHF49259.1 Putative Holin-X, holin superfamily III [Fodinibius roseus]